MGVNAEEWNLLQFENDKCSENISWNTYSGSEILFWFLVLTVAVRIENNVKPTKLGTPHFLLYSDTSREFYYTLKF